MLIEIIDVLISGLINGSVYALMAVGLTLIYGVSKAFNFAYGSFYSMGGYIAFLLFGTALVNHYLLVFCLAIPLLLFFGFFIEKLLVAPLRKRDDWEIKVMMITLGLALFLDNSFQVVFGSRMKSLPSLLDGVFVAGEFILVYQDLAIFILSIGGILLFRWFLNNTRTGMSVRAVAQNPAGAQIVGIPKEFVFAATFAISTVMVGMGGILLAQKYFITPTGGWDILVKAWVITAFGGMGSIKGSLYAAFIVGLLEAFVGWHFGMNWTLIALFAVLLTTLAVRPQGLMGEMGINQWNTSASQFFLTVIWTIVALLPLFFGSTNFIMHILIMCLIWSVVASCWDLIMGFAGIFSFGQVAFFVIGAYSSAIISARFGIPPVFAVFIAGAITAGFGVLVGLPCLRLKGAYIALVTFAVHMILEPVLKGDIGQAIGTGGSRGILTIAPMNIFGYTFSSSNPVPYFYLILLVAIICSVIIFLVIRSHWGTAFLALKDSEEFATCLGVSAFKYKLMVFALTSFLTGMMGGFYAHYVSMLSTRMLGIDLFVTLMIILVIGGIGKFPGAIVGAFITIALNEMLSPIGAYRPIILGALVVVLVLVLPDGIVGFVEKIFPKKKHELTH